MHFCWAITLSDVHFVLISIHPILSISSYARNQISTLPYEAVPRERDPSTAAASSVLRIQSLLRQKPPSKEADCDLPITEKAATVTEGGPLWSKTLEVPFCNQ